MPGREEAWHRNNRRSRQTAKGIVEADKLGLAVPEEAVVAAKRLLAERHSTDADTMLSWSAQRKMENRLMQNLMNSINGNHQAMPSQQGLMPWGKVEIRAGKAATRVVAKVEKRLAKVVEAKVGNRIYRDLANAVEECIHGISVQHSWNR